MKLDEILTESVTFGVARLETIDGKEYYSDPFSKKTMEKCWVCRGTGKEIYGDFTDEDGKEHPGSEHTCGMCHGKGENEEWKSDAQELNVSNSNAMEIQRMLGLDPDYSGAIKKEDFPAFRRHLIKLKNSDISNYTQAPSTEVGKMRAYKDDNGQSRIGKGATMHDIGRSHAQVERYIDSLLSLMDFAQKNDCDVVWG